MERLKQIAQDCFDADKSINSVTVVSDGNAFTNPSRAAQHAKEIGAVYKTFTRIAKPANVDTNGKSNTANEAEELFTEAGIGAVTENMPTAELNVNEMSYQELKKIASQLGLKTENQQKATLIAAIQQYQIKI